LSRVFRVSAKNQLRPFADGIEVPQADGEQKSHDKEEKHGNFPVRVDAEPTNNQQHASDSVGCECNVHGRPATVEKDVVEMSTVSGKWRDTVAQAANDGESKIHQRKPGKDQRQKPMGANVMMHAIKIETQKSDQKAGHGTAGVTHENAGRRKVVREKGKTRARGRRSVKCAVAQRNQRSHPSCNPIGAVQKVKCIHKDDDEQASEDGIENRMIEECKVPARLAEKKSRAKLRQQADCRGQAHQVIDEADIPDKPKCKIEMNEVQRGSVTGNGKPGDGGQHHSHAAESRDGRRVDLQGAGLVVDLKMARRFPHERQKRSAHEERQERCEVAVGGQERARMRCRYGSISFQRYSLDEAVTVPTRWSSGCLAAVAVVLREEGLTETRTRSYAAESDSQEQWRSA
jgi:hypothetical protein